MDTGTIAFLLQAAAISLSGVMAPGPVSAATVAAGARRRHAGALVAAGHGIVELPLMVLILGGAGRVLASQPARIAVGLLGGAVLLVMGAETLLAAWHQRATGRGLSNRHPLWTGVLLSAGNPYFLVWWATVGLALAARAVSLGVVAFAVFALLHWLCDLAWLEVLSLAGHKGSAVLGPGRQRAIGLICGGIMVVFGVMFGWDATWSWLG